MFFFLLIFVSFGSFGQVVDPPPRNEASVLSQETINFLDEMSRRAMNPAMLPENYSGSPYLFEEFKPGTLISGSKEIPGFLRYNVLNNQMEIKMKKDSEVIVLPRNQFSTYIIDGVEYSWDSKLTEDGWKKGYFIKYYEADDLKLFGFPVISVREEVKANSGYSSSKPAHYKVDVNYYLGNQRLSLVRIKNKDFEKTLDLTAKQEKYLKEHKLKEVSDAVEFLEFYSSI